MMKKFFAFLLMALATAAALAANPSMGSHGMLLFGGPDALYASHLPMFHAPHDYQVVLQVRLADKAQDAALRARLNGGTELWTLDPEKFELDRFAPGAATPIDRFKADLVLGHFEQGGKTQYAGAGIIVEKVLYFRQLSASPVKSAAARYLQLGTGKQRFLVKQIDSRPDFDHVVAVRAPNHLRGGAVVLAKSALQQPPATAIVQGLPGLEVVGTVYFSTEDLR
jgi:hypothetical protein